MVGLGNYVPIKNALSTPETCLECVARFFYQCFCEHTISHTPILTVISVYHEIDRFYVTHGLDRAADL